MDISKACQALNRIADHVNETAREKGFKDRGIPPLSEHVANIHGEVSELWEAFRREQLDKPCDKAEKMRELGLPELTCAEEELADIVIRALDTARDLGIDIGTAVMTKDAYNRTRAYRNGSKIA